MKTVLVALLLVPLALAPTASAAPSCEAVTTPSTAGASNLYLLAVGTNVEVWQELNQVPGLQRVACDGPRGTVSADSHLATVGPGTPLGLVNEIEEATGCQIGVPVRCIV